MSITALIKPNSLLLIGRKESVERVIKLIQQLDVPVPPEAQFQIFHLKWAMLRPCRPRFSPSMAPRVEPPLRSPRVPRPGPAPKVGSAQSSVRRPTCGPTQ